MARRRTLITYVVIYFFAISTAIRGLIHFQGRTHQWVVTGLLAAFLLLLAIERWLSRRSPWYTQLYLAVQTVIIAVLLLIPAAPIITDYFAVLFIPLTLQAMQVLPLKTGFRSMVRQGLRTFLSLYDTIEVVGEAANGLEAVEQVRQRRPDVVLMDLVMPELDGIEAIQYIPTLSPETQVLALTSFTEDEKVFPAIEMLVEAIREVWRSEQAHREAAR